MNTFTLFKTGRKGRSRLFADIEVNGIHLMPDIDETDLKRLAKSHKFKATLLCKYSWGKEWTYKLERREK